MFICFDCFVDEQVMFEKYRFDSVHIAIQAVLTLYAQGKSALPFGGIYY